MIQLIDVVDCDGLHKSIVRLEVLSKAVLVQDAGSRDSLFALLMVGDRRAVLVRQGAMSLFATSVSARLKLQAFRTQLDKADVRGRELRFCAPETYQGHVAQADHFDPTWFVPPTFQDIAKRFTDWRAGRATWWGDGDLPRRPDRPPTIAAFPASRARPAPHRAGTTDAGQPVLPEPDRGA